MEKQHSESEPSPLEYARFYQIAHDFTVDDPFQFIDHESISSSTSESDISLSIIDSHLGASHSTTEEAIRQEKLNADRNVLSRIIRNTNTNLKVPTTNWDVLLDSSTLLEKSEPEKLESPLLLMDIDNGSHSHSTRASFKRTRHDIFDHVDDLSSSNLPGEHSKEKLDVENDFLDDMFSNATQVAAEIQSEKLDCSKGSFLLMQDSAMQCGNIGQGSRVLDEVFRSSLKHYDVSIS